MINFDKVQYTKTNLSHGCKRATINSNLQTINLGNS